jgi:hypothetical protein
MSSRLAMWIGCGLLCLVVGPVGVSAPVPGGRVDPNLIPGQAPDEPWLPSTLQTPIDFQGFDDVKTTLQEALDHLSKKTNIVFEVNERAFKEEQVQDVLKTEIATPMPIPPMPGSSLNGVLKRILARIPSPSGAVLLVRGNSVEITTTVAARAEILGDDNRQLLPLVHLRVKEKPLATILSMMMTQTTYNVAVDPQVQDKGTTLLTLRLLNTPTDTALNVIADMIGLQVVRRQNVFYLTTPERAAEIRKQQEPEPAPNKSTGP